MQVKLHNGSIWLVKSCLGKGLGKVCPILLIIKYCTTHNVEIFTHNNYAGKVTGRLNAQDLNFALLEVYSIVGAQLLKKPCISILFSDMSVQK